MTVFINIDTSLMYAGKSKLVPGAKTFLRYIQKKGHTVFLLTSRTEDSEGDESLETTRLYLESMGLGHLVLLSGLTGSCMLVDYTGGLMQKRSDFPYTEAHLGEINRHARR